MAEDDSRDGMGGAFNALFAAAEASIDRLAEEKRVQTQGDAVPAGDTVPPADADGEDTPPVSDDAKESSSQEAAGSEGERETPRPTRRPLNPIHSRRTTRPMPTRKTPRVAELDEPKAEASSANAAVTQSLIKARNELSTLLEAATQANQALTAEKEKLEQRVGKLKANLESSRQRAAREKQDAVTQARDKVLKEFLPVVDNLERAVSAELGDLSGEAATKVAGFQSGVENVLRLFISSLGKMKVEGYTALGEQFDPNVHEAIRRVEDPTRPTNTVVEEYQKGYLVDGRLLRPAVVVVSTGGSKATD